MADKDHLSPSPDLLPGDPGWSPPPKPEFYNSPEAFKAKWDEITASMPTIEERMRELRRKSPRASGETMHRRIGPGPIVPYGRRKIRI